MEHLLSIIIFAFSTSITPGPNTVMAMASGINFGPQKSLPLLLGISLGFAAMLFMVGMGFALVFERYPELIVYIKVLGIGYLLYLAYLIAKSGELNSNTRHAKPLSFQKGFLFQWVNPKAWVVCVSAVAAFTTAGDKYLWQIIMLTITFVIVGVPCVAVWVMSGTLLKSKLANQKQIRRLNTGLSVLLVASVVPVVIELLPV